MGFVTRTAEERLASQAKRRDSLRARAERAAATVNALLADAGGPVPSCALSHAAKARKGNVRSLIALKCLDCCCWQRAEVAACPVTTCPLHPVRPYKAG